MQNTLIVMESIVSVYFDSLSYVSDNFLLLSPKFAHKYLNFVLFTVQCMTVDPCGLARQSLITDSSLHDKVYHYLSTIMDHGGRYQRSNT